MKARLVFFLTCTLYFLPFAQHVSYKTYTLHDGLAQMQVQTLFRDSRGLLWIGTRGGISKFDGEKFVSYYISDGLPGRSISAILEDENGLLWFASRNGICSYDGQEFKTYPLENIPIGTVMHMENDAAGNIWLARKEPPYFLYHNGKEYQTFSDSINYLPNMVARLAFDKNEKKIYGALSKHGIFDLTTKGIKTILQQENAYSAVYFENQIDKLITTKVHRSGNGMYSILEDNEFKDFIEYDLSNELKVDFERLEKSIYFLHNHNLYFLDAAKKVCSLLHSFRDEKARVKYIDQSGQLWLGSENGLIQCFGSAFKTFDDSRMDQAWSFVEDDDQNIFISSYGNGLFKKDKLGKVTKITAYENAIGKSKAFYFGSLKDKNNNLLFPHHYGLLKYDSNIYTNISKNGNSRKTVLYLIEDERRNQLVAGVAGGIDIYKNYEFVEHIGQSEGIHKCTYAVGLAIDKNEDYWIGSFSGLSKYNPETKEIKNFIIKDGSLPTKGGVSACYKDEKNNIWWGGGEGLLTFDYEKNKIVRVAESFFAKPISFITKFDDDNILVGAVDGLYVFDVKQYQDSGKITIKFFNHQNGYSGIEPNQNSVFTDSEGIIWIGSATQTVCLDPKKLDLKSESLSTIITSINKNNCAYNTDTIEIENGINKIEFEYQAIGFNRPSVTKFAYKLEGHDKEWSDWVENDYVNYSGISSGTYEFKVMSRNAGNQNLESIIASKFITVSIPFFKEPNFYLYAFLSLALLILGLLFLFNRYRVNKRSAYENELRATHLEVQSLQSQLNPHFIFNVIGSIQGQILANDPEKADELLIKFSNMIRRFLNSSIKSEIDLTNKLSQEITLEEELELLKIYVEFEHLSAPDAFEYEFIIDDHIDLVLTTIPPMLIQPYIENAIQHGLIKSPTKEKLNIIVTEKDDMLKIIIQDHGIGMNASKKLTEKSISKYKSHGRELVKKKIKLLNDLDYKISTKTEPIETGGTRVILEIDRS